MSNLPLLAASRLPQIWQNYMQKSTGQLSFISLFLSFGGGLARIFTTIHEIGWDMALLSTYLVGAVTTGILLLQVTDCYNLLYFVCLTHFYSDNILCCVWWKM